MATNVQGSASSIGMAPASTGMPGAGAGAGAGGMLPGLTGGAGDPAAGTGMVADPNAAAGAGAPGAAQDPAAAAGGALPFDMNKLASTGRWLGPLMTIGGGIAAITAFAKGQDGSKFLKWGGVSAALSGVGLTAMGFKAKGIETGTKATEQQALQAMQQLDAQYQATMESLSASATQEISTLKQQLAMAQQGAGAGTGAGSGDPAAAGQAGPAAAGAVDPKVAMAIDGTTVPGAGQSGQSQATGTGATPTGTTAPDGTTAPQATTPAGAWSNQSLVGQNVSLPTGNSASGTPIADAGVYRIEATPGDPNGYATLEEANAVARQSMSTELMGSKFLRWMVIEHEGRYYGAIAKQSQGGPAATLTPQVGNLVAWSAMNHVNDNNVNGWQGFSWTQTGGGQSIAIPYGTNDPFAAVAGGGPITAGQGGTAPAGSAPAGPATTGQVQMLPGTNIPVPGQTAGAAPVTGSGPSGAPFEPASQVGRSFSINASSTAEGDLARGGVLQVQKFVESSSGGFGTAEEAAAAARSARNSSGGDQWTRWVSMQGSDGRFYVYQGSIVKRPTSEVQSAPVHVFGVGFAEFFDASTNSWKAVRDAQAA